MIDVLVIGGGAAGMAAASKAKRTNPELKILVVEANKFVSYAPCGIPYYVEGLVKDHMDLIHYPAEFFIKKRGINIMTETRVTEIDLENKSAIIQNAEASKEIEFNKLIIATGAKPIIPPIDGVDLEGIHTIHHIEDGIKLRQAIEKADKIAIVGAGYIGLELTEALIERKKKVILLEMLPHVLPNIDEDMAEIIEEKLIEHNVDLHLNEKVVAFEGESKVKRVVTIKDQYDIDLVILSVGVRPNTDLFKSSKLNFGVKGAIKVNERMETNLNGIYAAGDVAETKHLVNGKPTWIPLAQTANKMGRVAGANVAGGNMVFPGIVGTAFTKVFDLNIARTGLSEREAKEEGFKVGSVKIEAKTKANYYPGAQKIHVKLIFDKETRKLLGGQIIGGEDTVGRVNVLATALYANLTVDDIFYIDLGYAPPFAPVWDPLVVASSVAGRKR